jgi:hypothetical protein
MICKIIALLYGLMMLSIGGATGQTEVGGKPVMTMASCSHIVCRPAWAVWCRPRRPPARGR